MAIQSKDMGEDCFLESDQIMIEMAARGEPLSKIAEIVGMTSRSVSRRINQPFMKEGLKKFCRDMWARRRRSVQSHWDTMEKCFVDIVNAPDETVFARIAAATQIKSMCFQAMELDVEDELDELRERLASVEAAVSGGSETGRLEDTSEDDE